MHAEKIEDHIYGFMAEFETPEQLTEATQKAIDAGYKKVDAYTPFPVEELYEIVGQARQTYNLLPVLIFLGGVTGLIVAFALQYYTAAVDTPIFHLWRIIINGYPVNIGGRPFNSWPAFTVYMFEFTVLFTAGAAVFGMFGLNGLPKPYHPLFHSERFEAGASTDKFFLCIEAIDPQFDRTKTAQFLATLNPIGEVEEIPTLEDEGVQWPEL